MACNVNASSKRSRLHGLVIATNKTLSSLSGTSLPSSFSALTRDRHFLIGSPLSYPLSLSRKAMGDTTFLIVNHPQLCTDLESLHESQSCP